MLMDRSSHAVRKRRVRVESVLRAGRYLDIVTYDGDLTVISSATEVTLATRKAAATAAARSG